VYPTFQFDAYRCGRSLFSPGVRLRPYRELRNDTDRRTGNNQKHDRRTGESCATRCEVPALC
jgi:hypothetical protein